MNGEILKAARIAEALLDGPWDLPSLTRRVRSVFRAAPRQKWPRQAAAEALIQFPSAPWRVITLAHWLSAHHHLAPGLGEICMLSLPASKMRPHATVANLSIPALCTPGDVATWLRLTPEQVDGLAGTRVPERRRHRRAQNYRYRWLTKSNGQLRLIESPKPRLKEVQRQILSGMLDLVSPHPAAHAFVRGRSIQSFLAPHVGSDWVIRLDLADFFATIGANRVIEFFRFAGYPEAAAQVLTRLCVNVPPDEVVSEAIGSDSTTQSQQLRIRLKSPHLPQGAPTSPALANLCLARFDRRMAGLAESRGLAYTRYCDDLVFSGHKDTRRDVVDLRRTLFMILADEGLSIRHTKTRFMPASERQNICGLNVNRRLNTPRGAFDQLRAILHRCGTKGFTPEEQLDLAKFQQHLRGRIAYQASINPRRQAKLMRLFEAIKWP